MSAPELLKQPWTVFDQLTPSQYRDVVGAVASDVKLPKPIIEIPEEEKLTLLDWWRERSAGFRSFVWTATITMAFAVMSVLAPWAHKSILSRMEVVRPVSTQTWPVCSRLSAYTDGCVYSPAQDLNWDWVAWKLDMPVERLRRANPHLPPQFIVRGAPLVIWRGRGRLED